MRSFVKTLSIAAGAAAALVPAIMLWSAGPARSSAAPAKAPGAVAEPALQKKGFGTIKGRLVWGGDQLPAPKVSVKKGQADVKDAVCKGEDLLNKSLIVDPATKGIGQAFAYLVRPKGENPELVKSIVAAAPEVVIDQVKCEFIPFATAIHADQKVTFKSSDPVGHNVHVTPFDGAAINQLCPPNGSLSAKFGPERRPIKIVCDIHGWMLAYLAVFNHPFFAVTATDGSFEIKGVPTGEQKLIVWQNRVGYVTDGKAAGMSVKVKAGETTDIGDVVLNPAKVSD